ncbi:MAG: GGDEF domain-containing protein [Huintestinicola sp.]
MIAGYKIAALCVARIHDFSCFKFIAGLNEHLASMGWRLMVFHTCSELYWNTPTEKGEASVFDLIDYENTDVLIIHNEKIKNPAVQNKLMGKAYAHNVPVIVTGNDQDDCISVNFDYELGFEKVVRHVVEHHKVRKLHFIAGTKGNNFSDKREEVFRRVLAENSIPCDDSMISYGHFWSVPTKEAVEKLIGGGDIPDAIICANDIMAITACTVLSEHFLRVPEDVIVTGFDGIDEINFSVPRVSSCLCDYEDLAAKIAEVADKCSRGEYDGKNALIEPRLILSDSCGCANNIVINAADYLNTVNNRFYRFQEEYRALNELSSKVQMCSDIKEVTNELKHELLYDMNIMLKTECIDESVNPVVVRDTSGFGISMYHILDTDMGYSFEPALFPTSKLVPRLNEFMTLGYPVIFNAIHMLDVPLGYVSFHFKDCSIENYNKISQIIPTLNNALGNYRNLRYSHYLMNRLEDTYKHDGLTGLYNRVGFAKEYTGYYSSHYAGTRIHSILTDLDGLKYINDTYGHAEGDNAIRTIAAALKASCPTDALCTRFGGDEMFAVCSSEYDAEEIKASIIRFLDEYNEVSGKPYTVSASVGIFTTEAQEEVDFDSFVKQADKLMYKEKQEKKNRLRAQGHSPHQ